MLYLYLAVLVLLILAAYTSISAAPWLPTRKVDVNKLLDDAKLRPGNLFVELGCGDGRVVKAAAKRGYRAVGYELNPVAALIAPPFTGLDTLPSLGGVFISLAIIFEDLVLALIGFIVGLVGIGILIAASSAVLLFIQTIF